MTFNYSTALSTDRDKIRFWLGDKQENDGPRPADGNFSDEEIAGLLTSEGIWQRAVAAGFEVLASEWTKHPSFTADNVDVSQSHISRGYRELADQWRKRYGYNIEGSQGRPVVGAIVRVDGYSSDIASDEVT